MTMFRRRSTSSTPLRGFDRAYYCATYPDVPREGEEPLRHYLRHGWREGRNPSASFNTARYLALHPDVARRGLNPLVHFNESGASDGGTALDGFDERFYLRSNPDVAADGGDPLLHFLERGWREERDPSAFFSTAAYLASHPELRDGDVDPLTHRNRRLAEEGRTATVEPLAGFDAEFYRKSYLDVAAEGVDPQQHYLRRGWLEGRDPSATFSTSAYLADHPELVGLGNNPLVHFNENGGAPGGSYPPDRAAGPVKPGAGGGNFGLRRFPGFDPDYYRRSYPDVAKAGLDPLAHFLDHGWREGRDPCAFFSTSGYLAANPDIANKGINPLVHFLEAGFAEGRGVGLGRKAASPSGGGQPLAGDGATLEVLKRIEAKLGELDGIVGQAA